MRIIHGLRSLEYEDIKKYTCNFSKENLISESRFGPIYKGRKGEQEITVKVWHTSDNRGLGELNEQVCLYKHGNLKGFPKPIEFCDDKKNPCAIVYDLNPLDSVHNLIPKDEFSWVDRIKVALGFASSIRSFDQGMFPFIIRNIDAAHIICDQDYTPKLCDFGLICGNFFSAIRWKIDGEVGSEGYVDPFVITAARVSTKTDVFAYGVVLLGLISKRVYNADGRKELVNKWAEKEYNQQIMLGKRRPSLVDESLISQPYFCRIDGHRITDLAMRCIKFQPDDRPDMDEVIKVLESLQVVRRYGETGVKKVLDRI